MVNFRQFISEQKLERVMWMQSAIAFVLSQTPMIPFTPKVKSILGSAKQSLALHVTDIEGAIFIFENQKKPKITLSVTTNFLESFVFIGVYREGIALILRGDIVYGQGGDMGSVPDRSGVRWVGTHAAMDETGYLWSTHPF